MIFALILFAGCSSIRKADLLYDHYTGTLPDTIAKYMQADDLVKVVKGHGRFYAREGINVWFIRYYALHDKKYVLFTEGYFHGDSPVGEAKDYYPNGKVKLIENYVLANDMNQKEVISMKSFNKLSLEKVTVR